jgi:gliding motility-associated lipoprotein GldH
MTKKKFYRKIGGFQNKAKVIGISLLLLLAVFSLHSCDQNRYFEQNMKLDHAKWAARDQKTFSLDISDTTSLFNFYLNIRNTNDYPFANIYVFINTKFPDAEVARDTIELQLADIHGKWLGTGSGKYRYNNFILRKGMRFVQTGTYEFSIEQGMRKDTLSGISDVGIRLEYYP